MVGKKKGFIFIADIFARLFRIYSKRRIRKAFFYEMKKKIKLRKCIRGVRKKRKKIKIQKLDLSFQIDQSIADEQLSWEGSNFMIPSIAGRPTFHSLVNSDFEVSHYFRLLGKLFILWEIK